MDGVAVGARCFRDFAEATSTYCASVAGTTAAGVVSCAAPTFTEGRITYTLVTEAPSGRSEREAAVDLVECQPYDWSYWQPVIGAWFVALVTILAARAVWTRVFNRETV